MPDAPAAGPGSAGEDAGVGGGQPQTGADSILIQGPDSEVRLDPLGARGNDKPEHRDRDNLVLVQGMSVAKSSAFVNDVDDLPPEMNVAMKAVIPAR